MVPRSAVQACLGTPCSETPALRRFAGRGRRPNLSTRVVDSLWPSPMSSVLQAADPAPATELVAQRQIPVQHNHSMPHLHGCWTPLRVPLPPLCPAPRAQPWQQQQQATSRPRLRPATRPSAGPSAFPLRATSQQARAPSCASCLSLTWTSSSSPSRCRSGRRCLLMMMRRGFKIRARTWSCLASRPAASPRHAVQLCESTRWLQPPACLL